MYKVLKFGACAGAVALLASCGSSEHFLQDDVYNTRTPIMPPGTDLNDVTDYATFVAKKEQSETPERTTYVSPRQYTDYFYNSQYIYYGYAPFAMMTGIGYYGYNAYNGFYSGYHPYGYGYGYSYGMGSPFYPTVGFGGYYGGGYNPYYAGNYYGGYPYYGNGYYGNGYGGSYYYGGSYTPKSKPNTPDNIGSAHAGTSAGRLGSSNGAIVSFPNQIAAKPNGFSGVGRNPNQTINSSPVGNTASSRPVIADRNPDFSRGTVARPSSSGRPAVSDRPTGAYRTSSDPASGSSNRTYNSNPSRTINTPSTNSRPTSSPTIRSGGGSSGGGVSGGGARSGGRR